MRRNLLVMLLAAIAAWAVFLGFGQLWGPAEGVRQQIPVPSVRKVEGPPRSPEASPGVARRAVTPGPDEVTVEVVDPRGRPLSATLASRLAQFDIPGRGRVPMNLGPVDVTAKGYVPEAAEIGANDLRVVLHPSRQVAGRVFDAHSGEPVVLDLELEALASREVVAAGASDRDGTFRLVDVPAGDHLLRGEKHGYVDLCASPEAKSPGLTVSVGDEDLWVDVPMYPIHGAMMTFDNRTNLTDEVLSAFVRTRAAAPAAASLPGYMRWVSDEVRAAMREAGHDFAFSRLRVMAHPGADRSLSVDVFVGGERASSLTLWLRPLAEILDGPDPYVIPIGRTWITRRVRIDVPVPMSLTPGNFPLGSIRIKPGSTELDLPLGSYRLAPRVGSLLDEGVWSRELRVPEQTAIEVARASEVAKLVLEKPPSWDDGGCHVVGNGGELWLWHHTGFPRTMLADPGTYTLTRFRPAGGHRRSVDWTRKIELAAGETLRVSIGEESR